jgi:hypothetical protein
LPFARDVDQDAPHQARRQSKEVPAVPQMDVTQICQAHAASTVRAGPPQGNDWMHQQELPCWRRG